MITLEHHILRHPKQSDPGIEYAGSCPTPLNVFLPLLNKSQVSPHEEVYHSSHPEANDRSLKKLASCCYPMVKPYALRSQTLTSHTCPVISLLSSSRTALFLCIYKRWRLPGRSTITAPNTKNFQPSLTYGRSFKPMNVHDYLRPKTVWPILTKGGGFFTNKLDREREGELKSCGAAAEYNLPTQFNGE
ncbi:hypothetical protein EOD39_10048 [Acipenser ruthenus]|uniref:Uncharacterized protein n=1 Tax=Acipenser ruthenus TaxID=7906 RepID=A0A444TYT9_ACIRT|nr:hypothetical protein EOD39_10048 [Acipenser ruthenus]